MDVLQLARKQGRHPHSKRVQQKKWLPEAQKADFVLVQKNAPSSALRCRTHTRADLTQGNWQLLSVVEQWPRVRAVGGVVVAPAVGHDHAVTSCQRFLWCYETSQVRAKPQLRSLSALHLADMSNWSLFISSSRETGCAQVQAVPTGQANRLFTARTRIGLGCNSPRPRYGWCSFVEAVEREFTGVRCSCSVQGRLEGMQGTLVRQEKERRVLADTNSQLDDKVL